MDCPEIRITTCNQAPLRENGAFVLYWMTAYRRTTWNFAIQRAAEQARQLGRPLVILEALRVGYPWASDRLHRFIIEGMLDNDRRCEGSPALYYPYVERSAGDGKGLLEALAEQACLVVGDDYPAFFLPRMLNAAARRLTVRMEKVDSNGLLPIRAADKVYSTAHSFRRHLQKALPEHLARPPKAVPLSGGGLASIETLPDEVTERWPAVTAEELESPSSMISKLDLDHSVEPVDYRGGADTARAVLTGFLDDRLERYTDARNEPEAEATSGLSPYLHFGHISAHHVFSELMDREGWDLDALSSKADGGRRGWWGVSENAESFLDELVTWRELGFNMCARRDDYHRYESLPDWARETLDEHADDERPHLYELEEFEGGATHDELWNAAQTQLVREGRIHNYLRMLWGKKILEWTPSPRDALAVMIELNNKYAVDGRDPNSYSGIFWCLGRYDRAWGPERDVFGKVRYMTSANTARKYSVDGYIQRYSS